LPKSANVPTWTTIRNASWKRSSPRIPPHHQGRPLDRIGEDIVAHYMGRGVLAKAMVISIDKATAVRTFDKVQKHWKTALQAAKELAAADPMDKPELEKRLKFFEETDMAVVVSSAQNEIEEFKKKGLDIATHRKRMVKEDLEDQIQEFRRSASHRVRLRHVDHRVRRAVLLHDLPRQAHEEPHAHADHRTGEPGVAG
jgi:hypothetical protein